MAASGIRLTAATAAATAAEALVARGRGGRGEEEGRKPAEAFVHFGIWELQFRDSQWLQIGSLAAESLCACLYNTNIYCENSCLHK